MSELHESLDRHPDAKLIDALGGSKSVAELCGFNGVDGIRRVSNWRRRGIPAAIRLAHLQLFGSARNTCESEPEDATA